MPSGLIPLLLQARDTVDDIPDYGYIPVDRTTLVQPSRCALAFKILADLFWSEAHRRSDDGCTQPSVAYGHLGTLVCPSRARTSGSILATRHWKGYLCSHVTSQGQFRFSECCVLDYAFRVWEGLLDVRYCDILLVWLSCPYPVDYYVPVTPRHRATPRIRE